MVLEDFEMIKKWQLSPKINAPNMGRLLKGHEKSGRFFHVRLNQAKLFLLN